jgi:hypothetical protein
MCCIAILYQNQTYHFYQYRFAVRQHIKQFRWKNRIRKSSWMVRCQNMSTRTIRILRILLHHLSPHKPLGKCPGIVRLLTKHKLACGRSYFNTGKRPSAFWSLARPFIRGWLSTADQNRQIPRSVTSRSNLIAESHRYWNNKLER